MSEPQGPIRRRWRYYTTAAGACPVREFLNAVPPSESQVLRLAMVLVRREGLVAARHLRGELYEVRATVRGKAFRILFAAEGGRSQVLLAVDAFTNKTQATPSRVLEVAEQRLADWRARGERNVAGRRDG
jgi:phage-related protein